jgi:hypothetical protein
MRPQKLPDYLPINNYSYLFRDTSSMGIVNNDMQAKTAYHKQKERILSEKKLLANAFLEIDLLKEDMKKLWTLVNKFIT